MKKLLPSLSSLSASLNLFLLVASISVCGIANAQYTKLKDFATGVTEGKDPYGDLVSAGGYLYGMTYQGGANNAGLIFKVLPNGTGYADVYDFGAGGYPQGTLYYDGTYLYGMTHQDGTNNYGTVFKILPNGTGYTVIHNFIRATTGAYPQGSLISDGTYLYGMTWIGGAHDNGVLFKILPNGTGYVNMMDFATASATIGGRPNGNLYYDGTYLYGMTTEGGLYNFGLIFKILPGGTGYADIFDFTGATDGRAPYGTLISDGTYLYGMTSVGGLNDLGVLFKILPNGTGYVNMLDFDGATNGRLPLGSLIYDGTFLYGMTAQGGTSAACGPNGCGTVFKIKPDGSGYSKLLNFTNTNGSFPNGSFISDGNFLYAMTQNGGPAGYGTVFKFHPDMTASATMVGNSVCVNKCNGSASASVLSHGTAPYTYSWSSGETASTATGLCAGVNTVTVTDTYTYTATASVTITSYSVMSTSFATTNISCNGGSNGTATVNMTNGTAPYTYLWSNNQTTQTSTGLSGSTYSVTISDTKGCSVASTVTVAVDAPYSSVPICLVTVDSLSKHNIIGWEKPVTARIDSFIVYREISTNVYKRIGAVSYSDSSAFVDTNTVQYAPNTGNPNNGTYRYKLQVRDTCGNLSAMSNYHNTIFINNNGSGTFSWAQLYTIENSGNPVSNYLLMRDDNSDGNWQMIASVAGTQQQVSDPAYNTYKNTASWRIYTQWGISCSISIKNPSPMASNLNLSKSNISKPAGPTSVSEHADFSLMQVYPNPSKGKFTITVKEDGVTEGLLEIYNLFGEKIQQLSFNRQTRVDLSGEPDGIYFLKIKTEQGSVVKKIVIQK